ncbi:MAG: hypothetical protein ISS01_01975 [Nanoarchaeota archaeon]|nr:hypothetical protein [Nanoarchaeota archaeon]
MKPNINHIKKTYKIIPKNIEKRINNRKWFKSKIFYYELAYLVGKATGDGHVSKNFGFLGFCNKNKKDLIKLKHLMINIFNIEKSRFEINLKEALGQVYFLRVNDALLTRLIYVAGAPKGKKVETKFQVPSWILNNKEYSKLYLQGILEDELTTIKIEKKNPSVRPQFKMAKCEELLKEHKIFMNEIKSLLQQFSIECGEIKKIRSNKNAKTWDLYFPINRNKKNIINFKANVGFRLNKEKIIELEKCCCILKNTLRPIIDTDKIMELREKGLSIRQISYEVGISRTNVHRTIQNS